MPATPAPPPAPLQFYAVAPAQKRFIGDRWDIGASFADANGMPIDLSLYPPIGEFLAPGLAAPILLTVGNGIVVTGPGQAIFTLLGGQGGVTTKLVAQAQTGSALPAHLALGLLDTTGQRTTYLIQPILPVGLASIVS